MRGEGGVAGSQPTITAVHRSPNNLWRSYSIFNLCFYRIYRIVPVQTVLCMATGVRVLRSKYLISLYYAFAVVG
jgi:hypothetical protein